MASTANIMLLDENGVARTYNDVSRIALKNADDPGETVVFSLDGAGSALLKSIIDGSVTELTADDLYGITEFRGQAFALCSNLESIAIPASVTTIGNGAFQYCVALGSVEIPDSVTSFGNRVFYYCSGLTDVTIGNGLTKIFSETFLGCYALSSVSIGTGVTEIQSDAFTYCESLESIDIPNNVTAIGTYAFQSCIALASVTIGTGISSIGANAFDSCSSLMSLTCKATTPPTIQSTTFSGVPATCAIYVPAASVNAYKSKQYWSSRAAYIQAIPT